MARLDSFLRMVVDQGASDLHFHAGNPPLIRHDGDLVTLPFRTLSAEEARRFIVEIMTPEQRAQLERDQQCDFIYVLDGVGRFRANAFVQSQGPGAVFRVIPNRMPTLDEMNFPRAIRRLCELSNGLVLVTGPTGSGKTTTLAAMVHEINARMQKHVITIEDPIEFVHPPLKSAITQRQLGDHIDAFSSGLRSALREAPDVLIVGEMRDLDTISLALGAAETGVLVFGTLHTNSAAKAIDRIIDAFSEEGREQARGALSVLLRGVIAQHLVKRSTGEGRVALLEILLQSHAVSHLIRDAKTHQIENLLQSSSNDGSGMLALDTCIFRYVRDGLITLEEAEHYARYPEQLRRMVSELPAET